MIWLTIAGYLAGGVVMGWLWADSAISIISTFGRSPADWLLTVKRELKPFIPILAPFNLLVDLVITGSLFGETLSAFSCAFALFLYFTDKDDDDRWKRRRDKAGEKIKSLGHKLVVAPAQG